MSIEIDEGGHSISIIKKCAYVYPKVHNIHPLIARSIHCSILVAGSAPDMRAISLPD